MTVNGRDENFGKHPDPLMTIWQPSFHACQIELRYMVILIGLRINTRLQVLDTERKPMPDLYAATAPGVSYSRD
jgi:fumarate reductase flavoprotein subunit